MANQDGRRGWQLGFATSTEYSQFIDMIIREGFSLRYQGASIDSFVADDVEAKLKFLLLKNKVPSGSKIEIRFRSQTPNDIENEPGFVVYDLLAVG